MPNLLQFIPGAIGQGHAQIVYAEVASPAPTSFANPLFVVMPDWSTDFPFAITDWPAVHGDALPVVGNAAMLITDSRGLTRCVWWDGQMVLPSGGDDTAALNAAIALGRPLGPGTFRISGLVNGLFSGAGSQKTKLLCTTASAAVRFGPAIGSAPINRTGRYGGFTVDGGLVSTQALFTANCVGTEIPDVVATNGLGDHVVVGGQNCVFTDLNSENLVLDNGCGGNTFNKPEVHGGRANQDLIIIRQSVAPPVGSFSTPTNNYFHDGISEFTNTGFSCLRQLAGNFNFFDNFNFFSNAIVPLVVVDPAGGAFAAANDALYFTDCLWTGNGVAPGSNGQYGVSCRKITAGVAQPLPASNVPVVFQNSNTFSGLQYAVDWGVTNQIWQQGVFRFFNGTAMLSSNGTGCPVAFNFAREASGVPTLLNSWINFGGGLSTASYYRKQQRVFLSGVIKSGVLGQTAFQLPVGYRPGSYLVFPAGTDTTSTVPGRVDIDASGNVAPQTGSNLLISLEGISFEPSTY